MTAKTLFISGIDTDVGKSIATGWYAKKLMEQGFSVITQKLVQTGCAEDAISQDIALHRQIQGIPLTELDREGVTNPYRFSYPASPHLAATLDNAEICPEIIDAATGFLQQHYDYVLIEGAGGLMVPLNSYYSTLDYIAERGYPLMLVTSGKLGSINHTMLSLELCKLYHIPLYSLIYNQYPQVAPEIAQSTQSYFQDYLSRHFPQAKFEILPALVW